tara:strand:+ start:1002 stop:1955 length:954 start_codon:yes stop_codon:yes gene_type:complete
MTDLSIIIVNWNTKELLQDCLHSLTSEITALKTEIIVVDNASTDGSVEWLRAERPDVQLIANSNNVGFAKANNTAIMRCTGRHVLLLNSDTLVLPEALVNSVNFLDRHADIAVMGCQILNADGTLQISHRSFPSITRLLALLLGLTKFQEARVRNSVLPEVSPDAQPVDVDIVSGCCLMVRRWALEEAGLLDERFFFFGEEAEWCVRFRELGWRVCYAPVGRVVHHGGGSSAVLNHRRDVMLTRAQVQLHRICCGIPSAIVAWLILLFFNFSRAVFWLTAGRLIKPEHAGKRARHFFAVLRHTRETWPRLTVREHAS